MNVLSDLFSKYNEKKLKIKKINNEHFLDFLAYYANFFILQKYF